MTAYYNEIDLFAAQWLRNLIAAGHIAPGDVDTRSIEDVRPSDLTGYTQCHFFAGIGVWSYALRLAGWDDSAPVWTGSCPCQPFSAAGKGAGFDDERHLWPAFHHLIEQCRPPVVFGEQVASKDGLAWIDLVSADLEGSGYSVWAVDTCAAGFGAPHIRQRLYWVGHASGASLERHAGNGGAARRQGPIGPVAEASVSGWVGKSDGDGQQTRSETAAPLGQGHPADAAGWNGRTSATNGFWRDADWLGCRDGKWRAVEPGTFPLADESARNMGRLRGYGNAIVAVQAQAFVESFMECQP